MESKEALEKICLHCEHYHQDMCFRAIAGCEEWHKLEKELERLEAIENAKPSEALKCLENLEKEKEFDVVSQNFDYHYLLSEEALEQVKQALLKVQEQEKELGCPLDVREQAFKKGFYDVNGNYFTCEHYVPYLKQMHTKGIMLHEEKRFKLEDYKKTWWLKKDKSE